MRAAPRDTSSNKSGSSGHSNRQHNGPTIVNQRQKKNLASQSYSSYSSATSYSDTTSMPSMPHPKAGIANNLRSSSKQSVSTASKSSRGSHGSGKEGRWKLSGKDSNNGSRVDKFESHSATCSKGSNRDSNKGTTRSYNQHTDISNEFGNNSYKGKSGSSSHSSPNRSSKDDFEMASKGSSNVPRSYNSRGNLSVSSKTKMTTSVSTPEQLKPANSNASLNQSKKSNDSNSSSHHHRNGPIVASLSTGKVRPQSKETTFSGSTTPHRPNGITASALAALSAKNRGAEMKISSSRTSVDNLDKTSIKSKDRS